MLVPLCFICTVKRSTEKSGTLWLPVTFTVTVKKIFLTYKLNFLYFRLCPLPLALPMGIIIRTVCLYLLPSALYTPWSDLSWVSSRMNSFSSLSFSSQVMFSNLLILFLALCWILSCSLILGRQDQLDQHLTGISAVLSRWEGSPTSTFWQCRSCWVSMLCSTCCSEGSLTS